MKTLQEQIDKFYKETRYRLEVKDGKPYYEGSINLYSTKITRLPNNLIVGGCLDIRCTDIAELPDNLVIGGGLYIDKTNITRLPNNLIVGDCLDIRGTKIAELPDNLVIGGYLNLLYTDITKLPDNLVIGDSLYLFHTDIAELPDNLVVGGYIYLYDTPITEIPNNLVVSGIYGMSNTPIIPTLNQEAKKKLQKIKSFLQWEQGNTTYIEVDNIFSVVDSHRGNVWRTHRMGKKETLYVVTDGEDHYAHGYTLKEAKDDLIYKINDRDTSLYENLSLDDELSFEDAVAMYRTITGACFAGTRNFVESRLPKPHKERYTIKEIIDLTKGEYGNKKIKDFFKTNKR